MDAAVTWFVVLPDSAAGAGVRRLLGGGTVLDYASGRPCLVTASPGGVDHTVVRAQAGRVRLAVIGDTPVTATWLENVAARIFCLEDADVVAARLPGSFHLVAVVGDRVRVQGTASGVRRVFFTRLGGAVVAGDRASVLAALTGARVDVEALAVRLLGLVPAPLAMPLWEGVGAVPPGSAAHLDPDGLRLRAWWVPPEPEVPLGRGAPAFAAALEEAVNARVAPGGVVACDLSGGLDSTPLSFLADAAVRRRDGRLVTFARGVGDPAHDDAAWARRALRHLRGEHVRTRPGEPARWFAEVATPVRGLDEPMFPLHPLACKIGTAALLAAHGARVHLTGHGGDELTVVPHCHLHDLAHARPAALWPRLRAGRARERWPLRSCLRALADRRTYAEWLADQIQLLTAPEPPTHHPDFGWEMPLRLPAWAGPAAVDAVTRRLRGTDAHPYAAERAQHQTISNVRRTAPTYAALRDLTCRVGAATHVPFLDDHVMSAALAVRLDHRGVPGVYKALTVAAMRPYMPPECLTRTTKADFSADFYEGLRAHRDQVLALADGSLLAEYGLADPEALRDVCTRTPAETGRPALPLITFVAVENWLRAQSAGAENTGTGPAVGRRKGGPVHEDAPT
ncbi:lasso peptide isopeptide bond-forming cyclase [Actinoallomurus acanthiterrae]